ncbi:interferon-induced guanylate-binding protein, putative [Entamoeba dispar SAW760]|uniref:Interferon-induced guanylate-binding protein, putative n=1 Tax=Entamoeba dispar (strain ATCC PRA-260 / SAW760) TaxID=370354 RepID=B0EU85_ENTDS|nr:interferon-induced guanylate-binding protein, putative [Entamoeba dispar SAW760]EDR21903.1 interferon-induced guanylate-binding protein, putative [Entamoeba dispar SAW760]|eukprot:EDR21903.1 interferon-induced guanylate-binding protein, putative [Entamoeba dispar SAW760]
MMRKVIQFIVLLLFFISSINGKIHCNNGVKLNHQIKPITLVYPNVDHDKLIYNQTACELLSSQINWKVISVIGPYHSGKSFLLNSLTNITDIFPVVNSNKPTTQGIQIFISEKEGIVYLDTEGLSSGLANSTEAYDAMIYSIAALSSNLMIYNTIRTIDQQQLDYLELLSRRAQLFALKSELQNSGNLSKSFVSFPPLFWVVRDYALDERTESWFFSLLEASQRKEFGKATSEKNTENESIRLQKLFEKMKAFTLFLPHINKENLKELKIQCLNEEFLNDLQILKKSIQETIKGVGISARQFCSTINFYVHAANKNLFPVIPSVWNGYIKSLKLSVKESVFDYAKNNTDKINEQNIVFTEEEINNKIEIIKQNCKRIAEQMLFGIKDLTENVLQDIEIDISRPIKELKERNNEKIQNYIKEEAKKNKNELIELIKENNMPLNKKELNIIINKLKKRYNQRMENIFNKFHSTEIDEGIKQETFQEIFNKNKIILNEVLNSLELKTINLFSTQTELMSNNKLINELNQRIHQSLLFFDKDTIKFNDWEEVSFIRTKIENQLINLKEETIKKNLKELFQFLQNEKNKRINEFIEQINTIKMPLIDSQLNEIINKIEKNILLKMNFSCKKFINDETYTTVFNELQLFINTKKKILDQQNSEMFVQITLHDFDRIRKQIKKENHSFFNPWSLKKEYKKLYSDAIANSIPDLKTRNKVVENFILDEYKTEIKNVTLKFTSGIILIFSIIATLIYKFFM